MEQTQDTTQQNLNWLEQEEAQLKKTFEGERLPGLKLDENKLTIVEIDFSKQWQTYTDEKGRMKAIIPCSTGGVKCNFWLNKNNPLYAELIRAGRTGQTVFKVFRTGQQDKTRYTIVKD